MTYSITFHDVLFLSQHFSFLIMLVCMHLYFYKYSSSVLASPLLICTILAYYQGSSFSLSFSPLVKLPLNILKLSPQSQSSRILCFTEVGLYVSIACVLQLPVSSSFLSILLCFPLVPPLARCLIPTVCISFTSFYPCDFGSNHSFLEYSLQNIPLYCQIFYHLLSSSISFVILLTVGVYKSHSSLLSFPMLVYLVLLASINSLVTSLDFNKSLPYF